MTLSTELTCEALLVQWRDHQDSDDCHELGAISIDPFALLVVPNFQSADRSNQKFGTLHLPSSTHLRRDGFLLGRETGRTAGPRCYAHPPFARLPAQQRPKLHPQFEKRVQRLLLQNRTRLPSKSSYHPLHRLSLEPYLESKTGIA